MTPPRPRVEAHPERLVFATAEERPDLWERGADLDADVWPTYNHHGNVLNRFWPRLDREFGAFQFVLYDEARDELLAHGHSIPFRWDGTVADLPAGIDGLIEAAFALRAEGTVPNTLGALGVEIPPAHQGRRLSNTMLAAMSEIAVRHGLGDLVAPVRPSWKERYPLTSIERYASWTDDEGLPLDPWMRVHARMGAEILASEASSLRIAADVASWEQWTEMRFPESGEYVFPRGLATLRIDVEADSGEYFEPNVWMRHRLV